MSNNWISIEYIDGLIVCSKEPPFEVPVKCKLQHWFTKGVEEHELIRVEASDHEWVTADDRTEIDFNWNVIGWLEALTL